MGQLLQWLRAVQLAYTRGATHGEAQVQDYVRANLDKLFDRS
jgi:hypothetical protein